MNKVLEERVHHMEQKMYMIDERLHMLTEMIALLRQNIDTLTTINKLGVSSAIPPTPAAASLVDHHVMEEPLEKEEITQAPTSTPTRMRRTRCTM